MKLKENREVYIYETLIERGLFTEEELDLITNINGFSEDTLNDCIYSRYGYRSLEQMDGEEDDDEEEED
jgi:hypothetical protein